MASIVSPIAAFCTCKARGRANRAARARAPEARASRKPELAQAARTARPVPRRDTAPLPRPGITPYPARHAGSAGSARRWWPRWAAAPGPCHPPPPASYRRARPRSATSRHARSQTHPAPPHHRARIRFRPFGRAKPRHPTPTHTRIRCTARPRCGGRNQGAQPGGQGCSPKSAQPPSKVVAGHPAPACSAAVRPDNTGRAKVASGARRLRRDLGPGGQDQDGEPDHGRHHRA